MRVNLWGVAGGILAFYSLLFPWWTMSISTFDHQLRTITKGQASVYPYQATATTTEVFSFETHSQDVTLNLWFGWVTLALVVTGGLLGLAGGVTAWRRRMLFALGGIFLVSSIIIFAAGLQNQISDGTWATGFPTGLNLFSSDAYFVPDGAVMYRANLSSGFRLGLWAGIVFFAGALAPTLARLRRKPDKAVSIGQSQVHIEPS